MDQSVYAERSTSPAPATCATMAWIEASTRLRRAIHLNDLSLVKRIVKNNPQLCRNPDFADNGNTSLHLAAQLGLLHIAEFLVDFGHEDASISRNANMDTPLHVAVESKGKDGEATAELLARRFTRCIGWKNAQGADAVMLTSCHPSNTLLNTLLALTLFPSPSPIQAPFIHHNSSGLTSSPSPPMSSSSTPPPGAPPPPPPSASLPPGFSQPYNPVTATDHVGNTALHYASSHGELKAIRTLLEHGADPNACNAWAWTPVAYSASVQAEVYFKGLIAAAGIAVESISVGVGSGGGAVGAASGSTGGGSAVDERRMRGGSGGKGGVRLVDPDGPTSSSSPITPGMMGKFRNEEAVGVRSRAGSGE